MYIDELLILNFVIDYILLKSMSMILKLNTKNINIIYACLIGEASILYLFINMNNLELWIFKLVLGVIINYIAFGYSNYKTFIKNIICFYILSFFLGGVLYYFKINSIFKYKYYLIFIPFIMNIFEYFIYNLSSVLRLRYKVTIYLNNGKVLYLTGYMDSANSLIEPYSNKKVIIINKKVDEEFFLVPYETIDSTSLLKCFKPKKVYIDGLGERNDIVVGIINKRFNGYNCLLNYKIMEAK